MQHHTVPVRFHGNAREYFGIWIVNLLLSIVTLGIYSAWAKVRTNKYFYQNTEIAGQRFDYHATGLQILIGRVIIVLGFVVFQLLALAPLVLAVVVIAFLFIFPWLVVRSLRFNARVSSWSNLRFNFDGAAMQAFLVYLLYPFLSAFTLYLAYPFADRARRRYVIGHHLLGRARLSFDSPIGPFYVAWLAFLGTVIVLLALVLASSATTLISLANDVALFGDENALAGHMMVLLRAYFAAIAAIVAGGLVYAAIIRNILFCSTEIEGGHKLRSRVAIGRYVWIGLSNAVAIILTLGLMLPWAKVRMAHYLATATTLEVAGDLEGFIGDLLPEGGALGDAYTDLEAIDLGLPV